MAYSVGGIVSGIDTDTIVSQLVAAAGRPRQAIARQRAVLETKKEAFGTLNSRLGSLKTSLEALDTEVEFRAAKGISGNEDAVGVTVAGNAAIGSFSVGVTQLAQAAMVVSDGIAGVTSKTADGAIGTGTLGVTYNGTTTSVTIDSSSSSLQDVVDALNDQVEGIQAYVMDTGDATSPYRIVLGGEQTGADYGITIDTSGLAGGTVPSFTEEVAAQDAILTVNGVSITHADNDVEDVVEGVTFHAMEVTTGSVSVNVSRDVDAMVDQIKSFVAAYNNVSSFIRTQTAYNPDADIKGAFVGESTHRAVQQSLQVVMGSTYTASSTMTALSGMGFSTKQNGDLELDEDELRAALADNYDGCVKLFTSTTGVNEALRNKIDELTDDEGIVQSRVDGLDEAIERQDDRLDRIGKRLEAYEARLKRQFQSMELSMARFQNAGSSLMALMPAQQTSNGQGGG